MIHTGIFDLVAKAGVATLVAAIVAGVVSLLVARRTVYINSVTAERSKWIDKLRTNLAALAGTTAYLHHKVYVDVGYLKLPEHDEKVRELEKLEAEIRLQLNPKGTIDQNILMIVEKIGRYADMPKDDRFALAHALLIRHSQFLLKQEWETVKSEASGFLWRIHLSCKRRQRDKEYQEYVSGDGTLDVLSAIK